MLATIPDSEGTSTSVLWLKRRFKVAVSKSPLHLGQTDYIIARQNPELSLYMLADDQSWWSKCSVCFSVSDAPLQPPQSPLLEYNKLLYKILHMLSARAQTSKPNKKLGSFGWLFLSYRMGRVWVWVAMCASHHSEAEQRRAIVNAVLHSGTGDRTAE